MEPVVLRLDARAAALVGAGEIVVEKGVPAEHEVSGVVHVFGKGEPAMAKAEIANPPLGTVLFAAGNFHAARAELREQRMTRRIPKRQQHVAFPGESSVPVELEIEPGASVVGKAGQHGFPGGIEQPHAVVEAALQRHIDGIEVVERA